MHIPLFLVIEPFIEFGGVSYPIPVWLIIIHVWLLIESRSVYVNMQSPIHYFGILTGAIGFIPGLMLHVIPNIFVVLYGLFFIGKIFKKGEYKSTKKKGMVGKLLSKIPLPKITFGEVEQGNKESLKSKEEDEIRGREDKEYVKPVKREEKRNKDKYLTREDKTEDDKGYGLLDYNNTKEDDNYYEEFGYGSSEESVNEDSYNVSYDDDSFERISEDESEIDWEDVEIDLDEDEWDDDEY